MVMTMRDTAEAHYSYRDTPPGHYTLKIDSFSKTLDALRRNGQKCYTTQIFEAGGYKWKLSLYPKGDEARRGKGYISMYLTVEDTKALPIGWEVNVVYKFFVLDQIRHKFLAIEDSLRTTSRFNATMTEWGISKMLRYGDFKNRSNGFLIEDTCVFGAEIFVIPCTRVGEYISVEDFRGHKYKWEIYPFSSYTKEFYVSDVFTTGNFKWNLKLYPRGYGVGEDNSMSVYLNAVGLEAEAKVHAKFKLCIHDQYAAKHMEEKGDFNFTWSSPSWGFREFVSFDDLNSPSRGFLVKDTMIIEVHITDISTLSNVSPS